MRKSMKHNWSIIAAALILSLIACSCGGRPKGEHVTPSGGVFKIDTRTIGKGQVAFFHYDTAGKEVEFMVAKTATGSIKTAFDACRTCYVHKLGYRDEGGKVVCVYCGMTFDIESLDKGEGNCVPIRIEHRMEGAFVVIDQKEIEAGAVWF